MKYMGSKRVILQNGLGALIRAEGVDCGRFIDLFSGAGHVATFAAECIDRPVLSTDLQTYAQVLAAAVIERTTPRDGCLIARRWIENARRAAVSDNIYAQAIELESEAHFTGRVRASRKLCTQAEAGTVTAAYGGHYFSPLQSIWIDALLATSPHGRDRSICRAALIGAASRAASAPGHTAQPLQPSSTANELIKRAWAIDIPAYVERELESLGSRHAKRRGRAFSEEARQFCRRLKASDLVFLDPPYSAVHYSRFYHVLETIARGKCGPVSGIGRYPPSTERPRSNLSIKTRAFDTLVNILEEIAHSGATSILTFPQAACSNGISGKDLIDRCRTIFRVRTKTVRSRFSTLGGDYNRRAPRQGRNELILTLSPKR